MWELTKKPEQPEYLSNLPSALLKHSVEYKAISS